MRKIWILTATALSLAWLLTSCGKPQNKGESQTPAVTQGTEPTESSSAPETMAPGTDTEFKVITGKVAAVSDTFSSVTIAGEAGNIQFPISTADLATTYEITPEVEVTVIYKGEVQGTDAADVTVVAVMDAQKDAQVQTVNGSVIDQAMSAFTLKTESGKEMSFLKNNCEGINTGILEKAQSEPDARIKVTYISLNLDLGVTEGDGSSMNYPLKVENIS